MRPVRSGLSFIAALLAVGGVGCSSSSSCGGERCQEDAGEHHDVLDTEQAAADGPSSGDGAGGGADDAGSPTEDAAEVEGGTGGSAADVGIDGASVDSVADAEAGVGDVGACVPSVVDIGTLTGDEGSYRSRSTTPASRARATGAAAPSQGTRPFVFSGGVIKAVTTLDIPGFESTQTQANGISGNGKIVGSGFNRMLNNSQYPEAMVWPDGPSGTPWMLGTLGLDAAATAINDAGQVIGRSRPCSDPELGRCLGPNTKYRAFFWQSGGPMRDLGTLGGPVTRANAINSSGQVVGGSLIPGGDEHAILWENGTLRDLGTLGGATSIAKAIDDAGRVFGISATATGETHVFRWQAGSMQDLGALPVVTISDILSVSLNAAGQAAGTFTVLDASTNSGSERAFFWSAGVTRELTFGGLHSSATAIGASGHVIGVAQNAAGVTRGFLWDGRAMQDLPFGPVAVNASGQVTGYTGKARATHSFLYTPCP